MTIQTTENEEKEEETMDPRIEKINPEMDDLTIDTPTQLEQRIKNQNKKLTGTQLRNIHRTQQIIQGIRQGKTYTQIAENLTISRPQLYSIIDRNEVQELMYRELMELDTEQKQIINKLLNSESPVNQRTGAKLNEKRIKRIQDKVQPTLFQTKNLTITADLKNLQQQTRIHNQTIQQLPPKCRKQYWKTYQQIEQQHQTHQNTTNQNTQT